MENFSNIPLLMVLLMVGALLIHPKIGMARAALVAALISLACNPASIPSVLALASKQIFTVIVVMSATTLPVIFILEDGIGEKISAAIVRLFAHRFLRRVPTSVLLPVIFLPISMVIAMWLHNIPAISVLAPLAIVLAKRFSAPINPVLFGMLVASNLGGASFAAGDTPAILQRQAFGFDVATFSSAMVPRNLVVLLALIVAVTIWSWWPNRHKNTSWLELYDRLMARDTFEVHSCVVPKINFRRIGAFAALATIFGSQFFSSTATLLVALAIMVIFLATSSRFMVSAFILGQETIIAIVGLFVLAVSVEQTPLMHSLVQEMIHNTKGGVELAAYLVTAAISADGAAAMLTQLVHTQANGAYSAAWSLASGICAGSSMLLTSASAGPILIEVAHRNNVELSFRDYAKFGVPFSAAMIAIYLLLA
jgi:Na+/H+ antiporter NhaD/arsenite permease-like protein